jgi:hypothetical protein
MTWIAEKIRSRMAFKGRSLPANKIRFSSRRTASSGVLACRVVIDPSWPVFMACSMSTASFPRHSPHHNPVGPHSQRVANQLPEWNRPGTLNVRWTCLQPHHVLLRKAQFGGIFDRDHAFTVRNERA